MLVFSFDVQPYKNTHYGNEKTDNDNVLAGLFGLFGLC